MADKNIQMSQRNSLNNGWDNLFPKTKADQILGANGSAIVDKLSDYKMYKSVKDSNGVFTVVEYKRSDNTLYAKSTLSGGTSPNYTTRTVVAYAVNGTTVIRTDVWTIAYDSSGDVVSEVKS